MEQISLFLIILSLMQNFIITLFIYTLLSLSIRDKRFFILVFLLTFFQLLLRVFPVTPLVLVFITLNIYIFYIYYTYKISKFIICIATGFSILIFMLVESNLIVYIMEYLFKSSIHDLVFNNNLRFLFSLLQTVVMLFIIYCLKYFKFNMKNYLVFEKNEDLQIIAGDEIDLSREKKITYTFYLVIMFLIIQGLYINIYVWGEELIKNFGVDSFLNSPAFINLIVVIFNLILLLLLRHLVITLRMERNDIIKRIKEKNALRLDWEKRAQMHDRNHHLSMLYILLQLNKVDRAKEYLKGMVGEIQNVDAIVKSGNQALNALIRSKIALAKKSGVTINLTVKNTLQEMNVLDWDLNRIIGNLLDNAIEAINNKKGSRKVELIIDGGKFNNRIEVITYGIIIPDNMEKNLFRKGYTSKEEKGHGLGLAICKELVDSYQGNIQIKKDKKEDYTSFQVLMPVT